MNIVADPDTTGNTDDLSLVKLSRPVDMGEWINVACLPETNEALPSSCTVAGWGKEKQGEWGGCK